MLDYIGQDCSTPLNLLWFFLNEIGIGFFDGKGTALNIKNSHCVVKFVR